MSDSLQIVDFLIYYKNPKIRKSSHSDLANPNGFSSDFRIFPKIREKTRLVVLENALGNPKNRKKTHLVVSGLKPILFSQD